MAHTGRLQGFCSSCIKPPCPHTIAVKCMTIFSFSELLLHGSFERKWRESFSELLQKCPEKKCPIKLNVYWIFKKRNNSDIYCRAFYFSRAGWIISSLVTCLSVVTSYDSILRYLIACAWGIFLHWVRAWLCVKTKHPTREWWCHNRGHRNILWFIGRWDHKHTRSLHSTKQ